MSSLRQNAANKLNARFSTGPNSPEGKEKASLNATTHGLSSRNFVIDESTAAEAKYRMSEWRREFGASGIESEHHLTMLVQASLRYDQCQKAIDNAMAVSSGRGQCAWDVDQRQIVTRMGENLSKSPRLTACELEASVHGCDYLIDLWNALEFSLIKKGEWTPSESSKALDLLGRPLDLRDGATPLDPDDDRTPLLEHLQEITSLQLERLEELKESLMPIDELDRSHATLACMGLLKPETRLLMRYQREAKRDIDKALKVLREIRIQSSAYDLKDDFDLDDDCQTDDDEFYNHDILPQACTPKFAFPESPVDPTETQFVEPTHQQSEFKQAMNDASHLAKGFHRP
jgi:hypothetical protein